MIGLSLEWERPLDGAELAFDTGEWAHIGVIRARSARFAPVHLTAAHFEDPVSVSFVNARDDEALIAFSARYGIPAQPSPVMRPNKEGQPRDGAALPLVTALRGEVEDILWADLGRVEHVAQINDLIASAAIRARFDYVDGRHRLLFRPSTLADFLLLEAALAREAGAVARQCEHCGKAFLTGPLTARRSTARYCSDRCRVAAMRARNTETED